MMNSGTDALQDHAFLQQALAHCAREAIHTPELVQAYGVLVVCTAERGEILRHSDNLRAWVGGRQPLLDDAARGSPETTAGAADERASAVGRLLPDLLGCTAESWMNWRELARAGTSTYLVSVKPPEGPVPLEVMAHRLHEGDGSPLVFELIPQQGPADTAKSQMALIAQLAQANRALRQSDSFEAFTSSSVAAVRSFLGYDRVMLYRFAPDWSGEVLSEATADDLEPRFIGQHFPASDIPAQARDLYTRNLLRVVADVDSEPRKLLPVALGGAALLDQSHCLLRQPSPVHLVYLRNMGVRATLTISLLHQGKLWGMLACHHRQPRVPPQHHRHSALIACELIADVLIARLDAVLRIEALERTQQCDRGVAALEKALHKESSMERAWPLLAEQFAALAEADHVFGCLQGVPVGEAVLSTRALVELHGRSRDLNNPRVLSTDCVKAWGWTDADFPLGPPFAGLVYIALTNDSETYIVALRGELKRSVAWGGRPDQLSVYQAPDGSAVLGARRSFEVWLQDIEGHSRPWSRHDLEACTRLAQLAHQQQANAILLEVRERNRLLGASLDLLHDMVVVTRTDNANGPVMRPIVYVNPAMCEHSGYSAEELLGQSPSIFQGAETDPAQIRRISDKLRQWSPVSERIVNYKKDGTKYWVEMRIVPIADASGWFTHWISIQRDISETIRLEQELKSKNDWMEATMQATDTGGWSFDLATRICTLDRRAAFLVGKRSELLRISETTLFAAVHPEDVPVVLASRYSHLDGKTQFHDAIFRVRQKGEGWTWIRSRGRVTEWDPDGKPALLVGTYTDISEPIHLREKLESQQRFLVDLTDQLPGMVYTFSRSAEGAYALPFVSKKVEDFFGVQPADAMRDAALVFDSIVPEDLPSVLASIEASAAAQSIWRARFRTRATVQRDNPVTLEGYAVPQAQAGGCTVWHGFLTDISDVVALERSASQSRVDLEATITAIPDSLLTLDARLQVSMVRSPESSLFGAPPQSLVGRQISDIFEERARRALMEGIAGANAAGRAHNVEFASGAGAMQRTYECSIAAKLVQGDAVPAETLRGYVITVRDVSERKQAQEQVALLAYHDSLTGLLNRRALLDRLAQLNARTTDWQRHYAVLFIDLDNFKDLNDTHGHHVGDELLLQVAARMKGQIRRDDLLARFGGDEFVIVLTDFDTRAKARRVAARTAESLIEGLKLRFQLGSLGYEISCSIGIAIGTGSSDMAEVGAIIRSADIAMYEAKSSGRSSYHFFDKALQSAITQRSTIEQDLRLAIERQELFLEYQPIVDDTRQIAGYEALIRWRHPLRGLVSPADLIPAAEANGLIIPIGMWVLKTAAECIAGWTREQREGPMYVSVNVSARQLQREDFVQTTSDIVRSAGVEPRKIRIELTESLMHSDLDVTIEKMRRMKKMGFEFSLDDFGTGYSSMSYLRRLPLLQLKIDRSFISDLPADKEGKAIASMIVHLARTLDLEVVAEGVESEAQFDYLNSLGCHFFQGYLFGRPAPL